MLLSKKGFFFIEGSIMILIAGIGVVSAAIFPAMTGYLERSRDTARTSNLSAIKTALGAYYSDNAKYPDTDVSGCIPKDALRNYFPTGNIPTDPIPGRLSSGCNGSNGMTYAYRSYIDENKQSHYILDATLEGAYGGNSMKSIEDLTSEDLSVGSNTITKRAGKEYIIYY